VGGGGEGGYRVQPAEGGHRRGDLGDLGGGVARPTGRAVAAGGGETRQRQQARGAEGAQRARAELLVGADLRAVRPYQLRVTPTVRGHLGMEQDDVDGVEHTELDAVGHGRAGAPLVGVGRVGVRREDTGGDDLR